MPELQPVRADHQAGVLAFELANRSYFATLISDRGDAWFEHFADRFGELLADQQAGAGAFYVLVDDDGSVVGRVNLTFRPGNVAELGYRIAERATGRGVATAAVRQVCALAAVEHNVRVVRAAVSHGNVASQKVLHRTGFVDVGDAEPHQLGGKQGRLYELALAPSHEHRR